MLPVANALSLLRRLKNRQLMLLTAIDESRSLRRAAASLNMTQPTATKLLQDLEATLGLSLFDRGRRGVRATIYGEVMIRHARLILNDLERTRLELESLASGATGRLRIGAVISAIPFLLARAVAALKRDQPRLDIAIEVGTSDALVPMLAKGELDVLLARPLALAGRSDFDYEDLIDEPLHIVSRIGHPLAAARALSMADLASWPWTLLPANSPMRKVLAPLFAAMMAHQPLDVVETSSMMTMIALLQESDMLAVMPGDVATFAVQHGLLHHLDVALPPIMGSYGILSLKEQPRSASTNAFVRCLKQCLAEGRV